MAAENAHAEFAQSDKTQLDKFEKYLVEEFYDDYREGSISRRTFIRRVAFITGSMAAAAGQVRPVMVGSPDADMVQGAVDAQGHAA